MQVISLGGGVQSTATLLMNLEGEISPPADFAIFADTGWERKATYENITRLNTLCLEQGFPPIWRVKVGDIRADMLAEGKGHHDHLPLFVMSIQRNGQLRLDGSDDETQSVGQLRRQCTRYYKIHAINRAIRKEYGMVPRVQWIGFSVDEIVRMAPSRVKYITHRFPLIEKRMARDDCVRWLIERGYPVPVKSACVGCPYRTDAEWAELTPSEMEDACKFDEQIRDRHLHRRGGRNFKLFLRSDLVPLREATFRGNQRGDLLKQEDCAGGCWL